MCDEGRNVIDVDKAVPVLEEYLREYRRVYLSEADEAIPPEYRSRLDKYPYLKMPLRLYVGSNGWAWEADITGGGELRTFARGKPLEQVFADAPRLRYPLSLEPEQRGAVLVPEGDSVGPEAAPVAIGDAVNVRILGLTFDGFPRLFRVGGEGGDITFVGCIWSQDHRRSSLIQYARTFATSDVAGLSAAAGARDATREVYQALVDIERARSHAVELPQYLEKFKEKSVLVLGSFGEGREVLNTIKDAVGKLGYDPVILDELPDHYGYDLKQKFVAVASVVRFLVFEDSVASGHLVEMALAEPFHPVRVVLRPHGSAPSTYMNATDEQVSDRIRVFEYDPPDPAAVLAEAFAWAEQRIQKAKQDSQKVLPWREAGQPEPIFETDSSR